jgi:hypothetical protein
MTMNEHKAWAMQWKAAAPRLQEIRDAELRSLNTMSQQQSSAVVREENPERNGLVIFQRWMMRLAILQQAKQDAELK